MEPLAPGVWLWRSIVNSTVVIGRDAVCVIDTQVTPAAAARLLAAIRALTPLPLRWAVNTHYHWDHCHGNAAVAAAGATIVAGARTAAAMVERQPRQRAFLRSRGFALGEDPRPPDVLAEAMPAIDLGGMRLELHAGLPAETADATLVWCPERRVLASGDTVMTGSFPIFGQPSQREGLEDDGWLAALDQVDGFAPAVVAPGHGPAAGSEALALLRRIIRWFLERVRAEHTAGCTLDQAIGRIEADLPPWIRALPVVWGTPRYAILRVWAGLADLGEPGFQHIKPHALPAARGRLPAASGDAAAWRELALQALEGGDAGLAVQAADAVIALAGDDPAAWTARAAILVACSRHAAGVLEKADCLVPARAAYERALAIAPRHAEALIGLGGFLIVAALRSGEDPDEGERRLRLAEEDPFLTRRQRAECAWGLALAARCRGDERRATAGLRRAAIADPTFAPAWLALRG